MTLALSSSHDLTWPFEVGRPVDVEKRAVTDDFGNEPFQSYPMRPGDAVIYRGMDIRHGRVSGNPNNWSAHMFLHWVEKDGQHSGLAFEGHEIAGKPNFEYA